MTCAACIEKWGQEPRPSGDSASELDAYDEHVREHVAEEPSADKDAPPPVAKYRLTVTITGNSHDEIEGELLSLTRGGYLLDSDYYKRDEFRVIGGRRTAELEHTNPDMTPEQYRADLHEWAKERRLTRVTPPGSGNAEEASDD